MTPTQFTNAMIGAALGAVIGTTIGGTAQYAMNAHAYHAVAASDIEALRALALADCEEETPLAPCASPRPKQRPTGGE